MEKVFFIASLLLLFTYSTCFAAYQKIIKTYDCVIAADGSGDYVDPVTAITAAGQYSTIYIKTGTYNCEDNVTPLTGQTIVVEEGVVFNFSSGKKLYFNAVTDVNIAGRLKIIGNASSLVSITSTSARINADLWVNSTVTSLPNWSAPVYICGKYHNINIFSSGDSLTPSATTNHDYYVEAANLYDSYINIIIDGVTMSQCDAYFDALAVYSTALRNIFQVRINNVGTTTGNTGRGAFVEDSVNCANNVIMGIIGGCDGNAYVDNGGRQNSSALKTY